MNITFKSLLVKSLVNILAVMFALQVSSVYADDIDIFTGPSAGSSGDPNVLIVLDNSSNWSTNNQRWPTDTAPPVPCGSDCDKQGYYELKAIRTVLQGLQSRVGNSSGDLSVNLGLMMFNDSSASRDGGYVRSAIKPMTSANLTAFIATIDTMIRNFNTETAGSSLQYGAVLFDAFKYFGGYTDTLNANKNTAPATNPTYSGVSVFGPQFWGSNNADGSKPDAAAYNGINYVPPAQSSCGKNYIIFIGNTFPVKDDTSPDMVEVLRKLTNPSSPPSSITEFPVPGYSCANNSWSNVDKCDTEAKCLAAKPENLIVSDTQGKIYECRTTTSCKGKDRQLQECTSITTTYTTPSANAAGFYGDEYASFLANTDVSSATGQQNITTFAIDVYKDKQNLNQSSLLRNMATYGKGSYFRATSEIEIVTAIEKAFNQILAVNSTFASASLPVSATNRSQNENQVYIGMFRPDPDRKPRWFGNLKRYQVIKSGDQLALGDQTGALAVSPTTGFIDDSAVSYWTTPSPIDASDLTKGYYWADSNVSVSPSPANPTITGDAKFSDSPDGPVVEKGSVAQLLRKGSGNWALNRTLYTTTSALSTGLTNTSQLAAAPNLNETQRNWMSGLNTEAEAKLLSASQTRPSIHGDVVHSRPLPITYAANDTVIYYGANDGMFRAISAQTGSELWAFAPFEFAQPSFVNRLRENTKLIKYSNDTSAAASTYEPKPYGWDGNIGLYQNLDNSKVWIYPTMRRGGQMVYGLNVTNKSSPTILWKHGCYGGSCTTGFENMGQSWSAPVVVDTAGYTTEAVAIFGGGYDGCEDANTASPACGSPKGANVYVVNAGNGTLLKKFDTERSVVSEVATLDINNDDKDDYAYVSDTGGNIYRIDMVTRTVSGSVVTYTALAPSNWTIRKIATAGGGRKFFYQPALFPVAKYGRVYLAIGSGDREHPLRSDYAFNVTNRFYVYLDNLGVTSGAAVDLNTLVNKTTDSGCASAAITTSSSDTGWFMDLNQYGQGEQTVTSALIIAGQVAFSTNRPINPASGSCATALGQARGYWVNLQNGSGTIGQDVGTCGGTRSSVFLGGGMPGSPVMGSVIIEGKRYTFTTGTAGDSSLNPYLPKIPVPPTRTRLYHKVKGVD